MTLRNRFTKPPDRVSVKRLPGGYRVLFHNYYDNILGPIVLEYFFETFRFDESTPPMLIGAHCYVIAKAENPAMHESQIQVSVKDKNGMVAMTGTASYAGKIEEGYLFDMADVHDEYAWGEYQFP